MTMITPSYLGETIEYSSLHACRSTLEDPTVFSCGIAEIQCQVSANLLGNERTRDQSPGSVLRRRSLSSLLHGFRIGCFCHPKSYYHLTG